MRLLFLVLVALLLGACRSGPVAVRPGRFVHPNLTVVLEADGSAVFSQQTAPTRFARLMTGTWKQVPPPAAGGPALIEVRVGKSMTDGYRAGDKWRFRYEEDALVFHECRGRDGIILDAAATPGGKAWQLARQ